MAQTHRILALTTCLLCGVGLALPSAAKEAASTGQATMDGGPVVCEAWGGTITTDPAVELEALQNIDDTPSITFEVDTASEDSLVTAANMDEVFPDKVYTSQGGPIQQRTTYLEGGLIHRTLQPDLIDIWTVSDLDTETPHLLWQRFRIDGDAPLETQLIASCTR